MLIVLVGCSQESDVKFDSMALEDECIATQDCYDLYDECGEEKECECIETNCWLG